MSQTSEKAPVWIRIIEMVLGGIAVGLSVAVIVNPDVTTVFFATLLGIALIIMGIARIFEGALGFKSTGSRIIDIAIGAIAIVAGFLAIANPIGAIEALLLIISIMLLVFGLGLIGSGITAKGHGRAYKIATIIIGAIVAGIGFVLWLMPEITLVLMVTFFSIGLLLGGIASIVSGATGKRIITR